MKRATNFWIALATAATTFSSLMVFTGVKNSGWNRNYYDRGWHHHHSCEQQNSSQQDEPNRPESNNKKAF